MSSAPKNMQVVRFVVGQRHFAMDVMAVQEVLQSRGAESVPGQPAFIEGVIELRGQYVPLIDLRRRFGDALGERSKLVIVDSRGQQLALVVDAVGEVERLEHSSLKSPPTANQLGGENSLLGMAQVEGTMLLVLNPEDLLSESEWAALPEPSSSAS